MRVVSSSSAMRTMRGSAAAEVLVRGRGKPPRRLPPFPGLAPIPEGFATVRLDGIQPVLPRADTNHILDRGDEDLAVAGPARARGGLDESGDVVDFRIVEQQLDFDLRQEIENVFRASIELRVAL